MIISANGTFFFEAFLGFFGSRLKVGWNFDELNVDLFKMELKWLFLVLFLCFGWLVTGDDESPSKRCARKEYEWTPEKADQLVSRGDTSGCRAFRDCFLCLASGCQYCSGAG